MRSKDLSRKGGASKRRQAATEGSGQEDQKVHDRQKKEQEDKKHFSGFWKNSGASRTDRTSNLREKKTLIPKMKNEKGETVTSRNEIANVFGRFCSKLYAEEQVEEEKQGHHRHETRTNKGGGSSKEEEKIPEFAKNEMQVAIDSGSNGIRAEDMKACDETTKVMIRQTFNEPHRHGDEFRIIVIPQKRAMWKKQGITAQIVLYQAL